MTKLLQVHKAVLSTKEFSFSREILSLSHEVFIFLSDKSNIGPKKSHISAQAAEKLRNNLALEFDFYNFVNARLDQQIRDIQKNVKYRN